MQQSRIRFLFLKSPGHLVTVTRKGKYQYFLYKMSGKEWDMRHRADADSVGYNQSDLTQYILYIQCTISELQDNYKVDEDIQLCGEDFKNIENRIAGCDWYS